MSVIQILFRVDEICKKYDKYDIEKQRELNAYGDDAFARLYAAVEADIDAALSVLFFFTSFLFINFLIFHLLVWRFYLFFLEIWAGFNGE